LILEKVHLLTAVTKNGGNSMAKQAPRKKLPKELAVINADNCTGCESCLEVCPVDCIDLVSRDRGVLEAVS
jgi:ferredoxin